MTVDKLIINESEVGQDGRTIQAVYK